MDNSIQIANGETRVTPEIIAKATKKFGTPVYLYDASIIAHKCKELLEMPNAFGLTVRYAMKANSNRTILKLINKYGLEIDASSMDEAWRAVNAGIPASKVMLTTQEVPLGDERNELEKMIADGMRYNVCSLRQLKLISDFAAKLEIPLSIRVHPGEGSGESSTRNTGDKYSCFGIHLEDIPEAIKYASEKGIVFDKVHVHIGSGGDPKKWRENIDRELGFIENFFPNAVTVNFGGGLKEARMPNEVYANIKNLGAYAKKAIQRFYKKTGRELTMEIEPGTYVVAESGFIITRVIDKKQTGKGGFNFVVCDGGMEVNSRPLLYGSKHPFYIVSHEGNLLSSEFDISGLNKRQDKRVIVGRCCESGDAQTLDEQGHITERIMANPDFDDKVVIGGSGAYCAAMTPFNYNSHKQSPEAMLMEDGRLKLIRKEQTRQQIVQNEINVNL